jgi:hypothetical protein
MKKIIAIAMIATVLLLFIISCTPVSLQETDDTVMGNLDEALSKVEGLNQDLAALSKEYETLKEGYENLEANYDKILEGLNGSTLRNPTWPEVEEFIKRDNTDSLPYREGQFDCDGYAITLRDNAWRLGIRSAYVALNYGDEIGHALNAFETTDKGVIFVDCVENDTIAYVKVGQLYGVIALDAVKTEFIACNGNPDEFWGELTWQSYPNPFSYDYYSNYRGRLDFFNQSVTAYNKAVHEYNSGSTKWSYEQLGKWSENLEALDQDLGEAIYNPMSVVESIEIYWN